jgi:hypothetical protein
MTQNSRHRDPANLLLPLIGMTGRSRASRSQIGPFCIAQGDHSDATLSEQNGGYRTQHAGGRHRPC